ncbi:Protein Eyes Shut [Manis pentadactyla]|nr:Protein Eyes Shut [Manis pentadactyla]
MTNKSVMLLSLVVLHSTCTHGETTCINCSEIIGQCQPLICFHGNCSNITANNFIYERDEPFSGPSCEKSMEHCVSQSCWKEGIWQNKSSAYICEYPEGVFNQSCETKVNKCSSMPCQNYTDCNDIPNGLMCFCSPIFISNLCKRLQTPHKTFPCMNNASCMKYEKDHHCSCMPGFTGKNCEKVTDHCRQLSINYLNEGWCFNIIGRFRYVCSPGSPRSLCWSVKNICLFPLYPCRCGAISHDTCQAEVPCPPQFKYVCHMAVTGSEGEKCEVTSNTYFFVDANCTDNVVYENKSEDHDYVCWFPCEGTMEDRALYDVVHKDKISEE